MQSLLIKNSLCLPKSFDFIFSLCVFMLLFLPFQDVLYVLSGSKYILWTDEIFSLIIILLCVPFLLFRRINLWLSIPIIIYMNVSILSGLLNGLDYWIIISGVFDNVKYLILIPIIELAPDRKLYIQGVIKKVFGLYVIIASVAVIQELCYWFGLPIFLDFKGYGLTGGTRLGVLRVPSIFLNPNVLGYYSSVMIVILFFVRKKFPSYFIWLAVAGVILSMSRTVLALPFMFIIYLIARQNVSRYVISYIVVVVIFFAGILVFSENYLSKGYKPYDTYFRSVCLVTGYEVWKDNPVIGVGPGRFGGYTAVQNDSEIHLEYFGDEWGYEYLGAVGNIDQFLIQSLAEGGVIGFISFYSILLVNAVYLLRTSMQSNDVLLRNILIALAYISFIFLAQHFSSGLNTKVSLLYYSIITGLVCAYCRINSSKPLANAVVHQLGRR